MRIRSRLGAWDQRLFAAVAKSHWPGGERALPRLSRAADNSLLWAGIAAGFAVSGRRGLRRAATRGMLAISLASPLVNLAGKQAFGRARPSPTALPVGRILKTPTSASFPSGHSASAAAFATAVALEAPARVAIPVALAAAAVCFSRVYTGVHYPGDVLAGAGIGVVTGLLTRRLWPEAGEAGRARAVTTAPLPGVDPEGEGLVAVAGPASSGGPGGDPATGEAVRVLRTSLPGAEIVALREDPAQDGDEPGPGGLGAVVEGAAGRAGVLAVVGGDDAVDRAARHALRHGRPLLVVPTGGRDRFARTLGVETAQEAVAAYVSGNAVSVDVAEVAGRVFLNDVSLGVYPALAARCESWQNRIGRWPATLWGLAGALRRDAGPVEIVVDGVPYRVWLLFVGNCRHDSRGVVPGRRRRLEDGVLDIRMLTAARRLPRVRAFLSVAGARFGMSRHFHQWQADTLHVGTPGGRVQLAGEGGVLDVAAPVTFAKRPRALTVLRE
ncbi:phosphoesterase [Microtetraspora sp. NBRC 13810]|uniref:bifunctional phosphatase PAP2/diacylglycerol kinase family protein n=1 Tax=Microtetraspora sp. NBRC 13810 TaxID=3030990 RepID=UPI0024A0BB9A|nr:phosphatase PAP2 family protein [Microtetraspora sp. NBRC 13810]GLW06698.1 phosphoesterase [Microtetraspora sp. NBRC 13810]